MKSQKEKLEEKKQANVPDGDSRPDHQEDAQATRKEEGKKKLSPERRADVNKLEDFRDAK